MVESSHGGEISQRRVPLSEINVRQAAWEFSRDATKHGSYINLEIEELYRRVKPGERAFTTELVFGSTRMRSRLDYALDNLIERSIDEEVRDLLRLALYEVMYMTTADHALVNEYVEVSKIVLGKARSSFINAVLRRACCERATLQSDEGLSLALKTSHPQWIVDAFSQLLKGEDLSTELLSHNQSAPVQGVSFVPISEDEGLRERRLPFGYTYKKPPSSMSSIKSGASFVQDFGSQIVCEIALSTDPAHELNWIDLCAGPGGKFAYLAHHLGSAQLVGMELHPHRAELIKSRSRGHEILVRDARDSGLPEGSFDRILLDAPCTGLGALRRRPDARWRRSESDLKALVQLQRELLNSAARLLRPDGLIIYVTCSPHPLETRTQVADFLRSHSNFEVLPVKRDTIHETYQSALGEDGMMQLMTGEHGTDGMFLALLHKVKR